MTRSAREKLCVMYVNGKHVRNNRRRKWKGETRGLFVREEWRPERFGGGGWGWRGWRKRQEWNRLIAAACLICNLHEENSAAKTKKGQEKSSVSWKERHNKVTFWIAKKLISMGWVWTKEHSQHLLPNLRRLSVYNIELIKTGLQKNDSILHS